VRLRVANLTERAQELAVEHANNVLLSCEAAALKLLRAPKYGPAKNSWTNKDLAWALGRAFKYLCTVLLAPRVHEAAVLWNGLFRKGWTDDRVTKLNADVHAVFFFCFDKKNNTPAKQLPSETPRRIASSLQADDDAAIRDDDGDVSMAAPNDAASSTLRRPNFQTLFAGPASGGSSSGGGGDAIPATATVVVEDAPAPPPPGDDDDDDMADDEEDASPAPVS